jgi:hypothetical protein
MGKINSIARLKFVLQVNYEKNQHLFIKDWLCIFLMIIPWKLFEHFIGQNIYPLRCYYNPQVEEQFEV